jgi:hypothetical protein
MNANESRRSRFFFEKDLSPEMGYCRRGFGRCLDERGRDGADGDKTPTALIATRELTGIDSSGREFSIKLGIGVPYRIDGGDWARPMALEGLHSLKQDGIVGVDSFQALMLARRLAKQLLQSHIQKGGQILDGPPKYLTLQCGIVDCLSINRRSTKTVSYQGDRSSGGRRFVASLPDLNDLPGSRSDSVARFKCHRTPTKFH